MDESKSHFKDCLQQKKSWVGKVDGKKVSSWVDDGRVGGWMDGWLGGKSHFKDCSQQLKKMCKKDVQ